MKLLFQTNQSILVEPTNTLDLLGEITPMNQECFFMKNLDFDYQIDEFMVYCRSTQLRPKSMASYEQALRLFERWCADKLGIFTVDLVTEPVVRRYINDLQERGKYTFYVDDARKENNYPERRRDYRKPISPATINNYIRNLRVFFNWLERDYMIRKNPMKKIRQLKYNRQANSSLHSLSLSHRGFSK
ncbi:MAG: phage integrase N-terminal SAM-like domain-containing protein [Bacteroidales bacterium]|nr:phage integrase N-terminal SAM-like domain-containing protein [Bacteroidales bacterium]